MTNQNNLKKYIYKICDQKTWEIAEKKGVFKGSGIDLTDGFIHFQLPNRLKKLLNYISKELRIYC